MPKSKRSKVVSLTKTDKKTKENKAKLIEDIKENVSKWKYVYVFDVSDMRNGALKDVRKAWKGTGRLFFGRNKVMAKALGTSEEEELKPQLRKLANRLEGPVGLFFTDWEKEETKAWFDDFRQKDFARAGNIASQTVTLPAGPIVQYNDPDSPFPHSMEPQLRKLGLSTKLVRGIPSVETPHVVCTVGKKLSSEQAQLLKLLGVQMAEFRVRLRAMWTEDGGVEEFVIEDDEPVAARGDDDEAMGEGEDDEDDE
ncbi:hypothetical protein DACRYDRAFT_78248 [Dacryopinax primogenitus]|uniref:Ribosome assembly factor mrt4 n=1 Tax=Dacryopinax primogenitus (strain DJM 731) TaxID=1858805 RepID=M5GBB4_DACPD|nr:uncharacterized protein DACRYDRAFT_78248 [Dacryopinax primogenitus]EJU03337.1 hypothetical protein DACRYDRAFT_78248 [Dacryopinax primogenitus]